MAELNERFTTLREEAHVEFEEKRSIFIGHAIRTDTEEAAQDYIKMIKKQYNDATHNVSAYTLKGGIIARYSDDGEPQGTSGMPTLDAIRKSGVDNACVVITRYFGGTLLGAGGLVRAYSSSTAENLDGADIRVLEVCAERFIEVDYTGIDSVQKYISTHTCSLLSTDYGEKVRFRLALKKAGVDVFCSELVDYMQGRVKIEIGTEYYAPFKE